MALGLLLTVSVLTNSVIELLLGLGLLLTVSVLTNSVIKLMLGFR